MRAVNSVSFGDRVSPLLKNVCVSWEGDEQRRSGKQWVGVNKPHSLSLFLSFSMPFIAQVPLWLSSGQEIALF